MNLFGSFFLASSRGNLKFQDRLVMTASEHSVPAEIIVRTVSDLKNSGKLAEMLCYYHIVS